MRTLKAKEFNWRDIPCVRFGYVEMPVSEAEEHIKNGRNWILCRTHAYRFEAHTSGVKAISSIVGKKFDEQIEEFGKAHGFPVIFVFYNRKEEMDDDNVSRNTFTVQLFEKNMMRRATDFARNHEGELGVYYPRSDEEKYKAELMQQPVLEEEHCKRGDRWLKV